MSIMQSTNEVQSNLKQAIQTLLESQYNLMQISQQGNTAFAAALAQLAQAITAPRTLINDANGNPVGVSYQSNQGSPNV